MIPILVLLILVFFQNNYIMGSLENQIKIFTHARLWSGDWDLIMVSVSSLEIMCSKSQCQSTSYIPRLIFGSHFKTAAYKSFVFLPAKNAISHLDVNTLICSPIQNVEARRCHSTGPVIGSLSMNGWNCSTKSPDAAFLT